MDALVLGSFDKGLLVFGSWMIEPSAVPNDVVKYVSSLP
jgi:hypothetical protein